LVVPLIIEVGIGSNGGGRYRITKIVRRKSMGKKIKYVLFVVISLCATVSQAQAEDPPPDKFRIAIGGYTLARYDSAVSLTDTNLGAGISISPQDTLGMDIENTVLRIEG
jgi:hypothetical protein